MSETPDHAAGLKAAIDIVEGRVDPVSLYELVVHKDEGSDYGVSFPDFPGCITAGTTLEEARANASEALTLHIKGMLEDGAPIPPPTDENPELTEEFFARAKPFSQAFSEEEKVVLRAAFPRTKNL